MGAASTPSVAFAVGGALVVGGDAGDWWQLGVGEQLSALGATGSISAAVQDHAGGLAIAGWSPELSMLRGAAWSTTALASPALALAVTPRGLVIADAGGGVSLLATGSSTPVQELSAGQPVLALAASDAGGLVLLLADGTVAATAWPGGPRPVAATATSSPQLSPIDTTAVGRVHAMFARAFHGSDAVLVAGARGLGVLERDRLTAVASDLGDRVAGAAALRDAHRAVIVCDNGDAFVVDPRLTRTPRTTDPVATGIAGVAPGDDHHALAWTTGGALLAIDGGGGGRRMADGHVTLAAPEVGRIGAIAIQWTAQGGLRARRGLAWS